MHTPSTIKLTETELELAADGLELELSALVEPLSRGEVDIIRAEIMGVITRPFDPCELTAGNRAVLEQGIRTTAAMRWRNAAVRRTYKRLSRKLGIVNG